MTCVHHDFIIFRYESRSGHWSFPAGSIRIRMLRETMKACFLSLIAGLALAGCVSPEAAERSPQGRLLNNAVAYFVDLLCQNKIPGLRSGECGKLVTEGLPLRRGVITYPASVTIHITKKGDDSVYLYTVVKDTADSSWRLAAGTRSDKAGHVVHELIPQ